MNFPFTKFKWNFKILLKSSIIHFDKKNQIKSFNAAVKQA